MSNILDSLKTQRDTLASQVTDLAERSVAENRNLTADEQTKFDQIMVDIDAIDKRRATMQEQEQRAADLDASFRGNREPAQRPDSAFGEWARSARVGDGFDVAPIRGAEMRAQAAFHSELRAMTADGAGGLAQDGVYGSLWEYAVATSEILQTGVTIINTSHGNSIPFPVVTAHATGASAAANAAPLTASDASLGLVNLGAIKDQYLTLVPTELFQDVTFDLEGYLSRAAGREMGKKIGARAEAALIAGATLTGAVIATGAVASPGSALADALIDLYHSVDPEYRSSACFLAADRTIAAFRKTKDSTGQYLWQQGLIPGQPGALLSKPVYTGLTMATSPTTGVGIAYFGGFDALYVRIAGGVRFERSNEYAFGNDQVAFRAIVRNQSALLDPNSIKKLQLSAS
jgi:HK97 family phage major capsid protein